MQTTVIAPTALPVPAFFLVAGAAVGGAGLGVGCVFATGAGPRAAGAAPGLPGGAPVTMGADGATPALAPEGIDGALVVLVAVDAPGSGATVSAVGAGEPLDAGDVDEPG